MFYLNGEKVSVDKLIEEFNVPMPSTRVGVMELHESQVRPDIPNGGIKHTIEKRRKTSFRGQHPVSGEDLEIGYSKATPRKKDGLLQLIPRKVVFEGHKKRFEMKTMKEEWVYFCLHPHCEGSPFNVGKEMLWKIFDAGIIAKKGIDKDNVLTDCMILIRDLEHDVLINKAKGMNISVYEKTDDEIKFDMNAKAKENPKVFMEKALSVTIEWKGSVKDAIDNGIFVSRVVNGMNRWYWGQGAKSGSEICIIDKGADPFDFLVEKMSEEFDFYRTEMKRIAGKGALDKEIEKKLKEPEVEVTQTKVSIAINFLEEKGKFIIKEDKVLWAKDETILVYREGGEWKDELEAKANNDNTVRRRLSGTYNLMNRKK